MSIKDNLNFFNEKLGDNTKLVAVSKTKPNEMIMEAYNCGQRIFGENKVQALIERVDDLPKDIEWHFIGHLQRNKVKFIAPFVDTIHAVDSLRLLKEIEKQAKANSRKIKCFLQFHIAAEESKFGLNFEEARQILLSDEFKSMAFVQIAGVMGMATFTDDLLKVRNEFKTLKRYFDSIKEEFFYDHEGFTEISMGMTNDYKIAIEEGSTIIRIGTAIFGEREKH
ncbi:MAG: YggS family pyridoxal phosphate-dependent enzyme [Marinilabiliales bacterium]|nr:MAG: YggS family pyridoxal phosphate-dependent enzyme [Marinilabiliales bacterium]